MMGIARAAGGLQGAAANLLGDAQDGPLVIPSPPYIGYPFGPNGYAIGGCWQRVPDPNDPEQMVCQYARAASIVLVVHATAKQARNAVLTAIHRGFHRFKLAPADLAAIALKSSGGAVILAVKRTVAAYNLGASSDVNPNPGFSGVDRALKQGAKLVARGLRRPGCPSDPSACFL